MRRAATGLLLVALGVLAGCPKSVDPGDPLPGLTREQQRRFLEGRIEFRRTFAPETGLGPLFNADSCAECHEDPVAGGTGDEVEIHVAAFDPLSGSCDPLIERGGPVIQQQATPVLVAAMGIESEPVPAEATAVARRSTPDILGFGLLDAVPESTLLALADPEDRDGDGISGRPNRFFDGRIGRFGRKALVPTLREFNAGAFPIEQGITNPDVPDEETIGGLAIPPGVDPIPDPEISGEMLDRTDDFVRFSAAPAHEKLTRTAEVGREIFSRIGCERCHVPTLETGDHAVKALRHRTVRAYTDLLLHDMGPDLADICFGQASPSEFRTEPLMGLRLSQRFLHDGRAGTVEQAIELHAGEAAASVGRFRALSQADRAALLEFLGSL